MANVHVIEVLTGIIIVFPTAATVGRAAAETRIAQVESVS